MKSKQFCSVCKEWLEMEVVPTGDGEDDDGVVWYRCPQCQGFLPKLKGSDPAAQAAPSAEAAADPAAEPAPVDSAKPTAGIPGEDAAPADPVPDDDAGGEDDLPWDSPADMMASQVRDGQGAVDAEPGDDLEVIGAVPEKSSPKEKGEPEEPVAEYAALLAETDQGDPKPYRPWDTYEVGDCIMHLAWEDCGVVVAKENLPGGRQVIKCFFDEAGVVRLIENAPR